METIIEIIGGAQGLLDISFDLQSCFEEKHEEKLGLDVFLIL
jgi:hypothetical protein